MGKEILELEQRNTWKVVNKTSLHHGDNLLPSTWAFKIKRYPDGRILNNKAIFCVRGYCPIKNLDCFESYAPFASCLTIRMVINIAAQHGWATRKVGFLDSLVQATLKEEVYVKIPAMFSYKNANSEETVILKLIKSLYEILQAHRTWYQHI